MSHASVTLAARLLIVCALPLSACTVMHFERNAPGIIDIASPPEASNCRRVERPEDPGENVVVLSAGPLTDLGLRSQTGEESASQASFGFELSAAWGHRESSAYGDDFLHYWPNWALGLNLGWMAYQKMQSGVGPFYLELQAMYLLGGLALGWNLDPDTVDHGPQGTLFAGPLYVRGAYLLDQEAFDLQFGLAFKFPLTLVWSR